jgi:hypothetical protein
MNHDEFIEYIAKLQNDLTNQQKQVFQESETLSIRGNELVQLIQSNVGATKTCLEFISDDTPVDDAHRTKLDEINVADGQAKTELAQIRARLSQLVQLTDSLRGSLGILHHLSAVDKDGLPTTAEEVMATDELHESTGEELL